MLCGAYWGYYSILGQQVGQNPPSPSPAQRVSSPSPWQIYPIRIQFSAIKKRFCDFCGNAQFRVNNFFQKSRWQTCKSRSSSSNLLQDANGPDLRQESIHSWTKHSTCTDEIPTDFTTSRVGGPFTAEDEEAEDEEEEFVDALGQQNELLEEQQNEFFDAKEYIDGSESNESLSVDQPPDFMAQIRELKVQYDKMREEIIPIITTKQWLVERLQYSNLDQNNMMNVWREECELIENTIHLQEEQINLADTLHLKCQMQETATQLMKKSEEYLADHQPQWRKRAIEDAHYIIQTSVNIVQPYISRVPRWLQTRILPKLPLYIHGYIHGKHDLLNRVLSYVLPKSLSMEKVMNILHENEKFTLACYNYLQNGDSYLKSIRVDHAKEIILGYKKIIADFDGILNPVPSSTF